MPRFSVILPAAGRSSRFGDPRQKKIYADLAGRAVWLRAAEPFVNRDEVGQVILAIHEEDHELFERRYRPNLAFLNITVIHGGAERHDTVARALEVVDPSCDHVAIHDAARPCLRAPLIDAVFSAALAHGAALPGLPVTDTLKRADAEGRAGETVDRAGLFAVQTPQAFRKDWLVAAYANRDRVAGSITDDAQLLEAIGHRCLLVAGSPFNLKITTAPDLQIAAAYLDLLDATHRPTAPPPLDERDMW